MQRLHALAAASLPPTQVDGVPVDAIHAIRALKGIGTELAAAQAAGDVTAGAEGVVPVLDGVRVVRREELVEWAKQHPEVAGKGTDATALAKALAGIVDEEASAMAGEGAATAPQATSTVDESTVRDDEGSRGATTNAPDASLLAYVLVDFPANADEAAVLASAQPRCMLDVVMELRREASFDLNDSDDEEPAGAAAASVAGERPAASVAASAAIGGDDDGKEGGSEVDGKEDDGEDAADDGDDAKSRVSAAKVSVAAEEENSEARVAIDGPAHVVRLVASEKAAVAATEGERAREERARAAKEAEEAAERAAAEARAAAAVAAAAQAEALAAGLAEAEAQDDDAKSGSGSEGGDGDAGDGGDAEGEAKGDDGDAGAEGDEADGKEGDAGDEGGDGADGVATDGDGAEDAATDTPAEESLPQGTGPSGADALRTAANADPHAWRHTEFVTLDPDSVIGYKAPKAPKPIPGGDGDTGLGLAALSAIAGVSNVAAGEPSEPGPVQLVRAFMRRCGALAAQREVFGRWMEAAVPIHVPKLAAAVQATDSKTKTKGKGKGKGKDAATKTDATATYALAAGERALGLYDAVMQPLPAALYTPATVLMGLREAVAQACVDEEPAVKEHMVRNPKGRRRPASAARKPASEGQVLAQEPPVSDALVEWAASLDTSYVVDEGDTVMEDLTRGCFAAGVLLGDVTLGPSGSDGTLAAGASASASAGGGDLERKDDGEDDEESSVEDPFEEHREAAALYRGTAIVATPIAALARALTNYAVVPGGRGRADMPPEPLLSEAERGAAATELATFTSYPESVVTRTQVLRAFERMVENTNARKLVDDPKGPGHETPVVLREWRWYRHLAGSTLAQTMGEVQGTDPVVVRHYMSEHDLLLVALHHPTPRRRSLVQYTTAAALSSFDKGFADWRRTATGKAAATSFAVSPPEPVRKPPAYNRGLADALSGHEHGLFVDLDVDALWRRQIRTQWLFPADHALVRIVDIPGDSSLTVALKKHLFGLRKGVRAPQPTGSPRDDAGHAAAGGGAAAPKGERGFGGGAKRGESSAAANLQSFDVGDGFTFNFVATFGSMGPSGSSTLTVDAGPELPLKPDGKGTVIVTNTAADGLCVESSSAGWIRQRRITGSGVSAGDTKSSDPYRERSRQTVGCEGTTVVKYASGVVKVLYADGTAAWLLPFPAPHIGGQTESPEAAAAKSKTKKKGKGGGKGKQPVAEEDESNNSHWVVSPPSGARYMQLPNGKRVALDKVEVVTSEDPRSGVVVTVRHDPDPVSGGGVGGGLGQLDRTRSSMRKSKKASTKSFSGKKKSRASQHEANVAKYFADAASIAGGVFGASSFEAGSGGRVIHVQYPGGDTLAIHSDGTHIGVLKRGDPASGAAETTAGIGGAASIAGGSVMSGARSKRSRTASTPRSVVAPSADRATAASPKVEIRTVVAAPDFATVEVDRDVEETAQRHSSGKRVSITKGGLRTRSVATLPDGTLVAADYDTRITSSVNGRVRVHKRDGTIVLAWDGGHVDYRPAGVSEGAAAGAVLGGVKAAVDADDDSEEEEDGRATPRSVRSEEDTTAGVYEFDLPRGRMETADVERNVITADLTAGTAWLDLAGTLPGMSVVPRVADPRPPRLFIMSGENDGRGVELVGPDAWKDVHKKRVSVSDSDGFVAPLSLETGGGDDVDEDRELSSPRTSADGSRPASRASRAERDGAPDETLGATLGLAGGTGDAGPSFVWRPISLPSATCLGSDTPAGTPAEQGVGPSLSHVLMQRLVGPGAGAGTSARHVYVPPGTAPQAVASALRRVSAEGPGLVPHGGGVRASQRGQAGLFDVDGRCELRSGQRGWLSPPPKSTAAATHKVGFSDIPAQSPGLDTLVTGEFGDTALARAFTPGGGVDGNVETTMPGRLNTPELAAGRPIAVRPTRVADAVTIVTEHGQLGAEQRRELEEQEAAWVRWQHDVAATIDRFAVEDARSEDVITAELALAKKIQKMRAPKKKKKRRRYKLGTGGMGSPTAAAPRSNAASVPPVPEEVAGKDSAGTPTAADEKGERERERERESDLPNELGPDVAGSEDKGDPPVDEESAAEARRLERRAAARERARLRAERRKREAAESRGQLGQTSGTEALGASRPATGSFWQTQAGQRFVSQQEMEEGLGETAPAQDFGGAEWEVKDGSPDPSPRDGHYDALATTGRSASSGRISVGGASAAFDGFELSPKAARFGSLAVGAAYRMTVRLRNMGDKPHRFRIGSKFTSHSTRGNSIMAIASPAPVSPGLATAIDVEILAREVGRISVPVGINYEGGSVRLLVAARILEDVDPHMPLTAGVRVVAQ